MTIIFESPDGIQYGFLLESAGDGSRQVVSYLTSYKYRGQFWGCDNAHAPEHKVFSTSFMSESAGREKLFAWVKENKYKVVAPLDMEWIAEYGFEVATPLADGQ